MLAQLNAIFALAIESNLTMFGSVNHVMLLMNSIITKKVANVKNVY